ncbi:hypothetical protein GCM10011518_38940 [Flavobacterium limi]|uniref:Uncharacterized protein n=1 Tax=Flavobacterium limi TaxID=2045105 RepID=A0ABQ1US48_9FLAO|nr:hypothetical protein GCM10011518_38940 [Flavobacterium limi]
MSSYIFYKILFVLSLAILKRVKNIRKTNIKRITAKSIPLNLAKKLIKLKEVIDKKLLTK